MNENITWLEAAEYLHSIHDTSIDWDEMAFECPSCRSRIDYMSDDNFLVCPICKFNWIKGYLW